MGSIPYVQFKPDNVTTVKGIVKVTTMYRSFVLVREGQGIFIFCKIAFCLCAEEVGWGVPRLTNKLGIICKASLKSVNS
jgi:hypothetical protein